MRLTARRFFIVVVTVHGLLHLLGAAKGLGLAEVDQLTQPITVPMGLLWLLAASAVLTAVILVVRGAYRCWLVTAAAAIGSQAVILTSWDDAKAGTLANLIMLLAAGYGYAIERLPSLRGGYHEQTGTDMATPPSYTTEHFRRPAIGQPIFKYPTGRPPYANTNSVTCPQCHGTGSKPCSQCHGTGSRTCPYCHVAQLQPCRHCHGLRTTTCTTCMGTRKKTCLSCLGSGKRYAA